MRITELIKRSLEIALHVAVIAFSLLAAFLLRFDFSIPGESLPIVREALWIAILVKTPVFYLAGIDRSLRRFAGISELLRVVAANLTGSALFVLVVLFRIGPSFPRSIYFMDLVLCCLFTALVRFSSRLHAELLKRREAPRKWKRILIYGAGTAGTSLLREIRLTPSLGYKIVGFLDDDPCKKGTLVMGVPVLGAGRQAAAIGDHFSKRRRWIEEIVIAMPSAVGRQMQEALANCHATGIPCKTIPGIDELLNGRVLTAQIRDLNVADLLERKPVEFDEQPISQRIKDRCILVTGAAGSIGSELCRQIARFEPARLVAFDQAESELFKLECELRDRSPHLELVPALGDIRQPDRLAEVLERFSVQSVFHAAAYKHVPMLESHALEAAKNNVIGTWNLLNAVRQYGIADFLMISSDKAVNPTNVMGATKRVCELMVSSLPPALGTHTPKCVSVRFGNVIGSSGSVIPIFQAQIAAGGPVKVTHPQIQRYFMTIPEAVLLVLQASTMGKGSEIFVLDMGKPIRITTLAENMIRLAGREPYKDIDIQFIGLRPGEKLYEEIHLPTENTLPTYHEKIKIFRQNPARWKAIQEWIAHLQLLIEWRQEREIVAHINCLIPEYQPSETCRFEVRKPGVGAPLSIAEASPAA